jgi:hypothetical protein
MSIEVVRITDNPAYRVRLGLDPAQTIERIVLGNETIASLPVDAQKHLARLFERDGSPLVMQWYFPRPMRTVDGEFTTRAYVAGGLPDKLLPPVPLTADLVVGWIINLAEQATACELEAAKWYDCMCHAEFKILETENDADCYAALIALGGGHNFVTGPHGIVWSLSSEAMTRLHQIETDRRLAADRLNLAAKETRKARRAEFVLAVVELLGSDSQKERLDLGLLPMHEVEILLHEHVLNGAYKRLCEDENLEVVQEAVRLPAGAFEIFKIIKSHVDTAEIRWVNDYGHPYPIGEIKICPVVGYETSDDPEFDSKGERRLLCEVRICDDPAHSDWSSEAVYYLD